MCTQHQTLIPTTILGPCCFAVVTYALREYATTGVLPVADAFATAFTQDKLLAEVRCRCKLGGGGQTIHNCLKLKSTVSLIIVIMLDHIRGGAQAPWFRLMRIRMMDQLQQVPTTYNSTALTRVSCMLSHVEISGCFLCLCKRRAWQSGTQC